MEFPLDFRSKATLRRRSSKSRTTIINNNSRSTHRIIITSPSTTSRDLLLSNSSSRRFSSRWPTLEDRRRGSRRLNLILIIIIPLLLLKVASVACLTSRPPLDPTSQPRDRREVNQRPRYSSNSTNNIRDCLELIRRRTSRFPDWHRVVRTRLRCHRDPPDKNSLLCDLSADRDLVRVHLTFGRVGSKPFVRLNPSSIMVVLVSVLNHFYSLINRYCILKS